MDTPKDVFVMGIEGQTYDELHKIAKLKNKSVNEVVSDALKKTIEDGKTVSESSERKMLCEG